MSHNFGGELIFFIENMAKSEQVNKHLIDKLNKIDLHK